MSNMDAMIADPEGRALVSGIIARKNPRPGSGLSGPVLAGAAAADFVTNMAKRNPRRHDTIHELNLMLAEISARKAFHQDPTPENLTAWVDANDAVEAWNNGERS